MKTGKLLLCWIPRVLNIIAIAFLFTLSFDSFGTGNGFWLDLAGFLIHNIPTAVLIVLLVLAWKWKLVGAISLPIAGIAWIVFVSIRNIDMFWDGLLIGGPIILIGLLYFLDWKFEQKKAV